MSGEEESKEGEEAEERERTEHIDVVLSHFAELFRILSFY